jgi:hypothetical protein
MYNTLKYHIELIVIDNFTMFKRQIKNFRKFLEKVALRAILGYRVLTYLGNLENVVPFVFKYIYFFFHNYWSNICEGLIRNVKKIVNNFLCKMITLCVSKL